MLGKDNLTKEQRNALQNKRDAVLKDLNSEEKEVFRDLYYNKEHPCRLEDIVDRIGVDPEETQSTLNDLVEAGFVKCEYTVIGFDLEDLEDDV